VTTVPLSDGAGTATASVAGLAGDGDGAAAGAVVVLIDGRGAAGANAVVLTDAPPVATGADTGTAGDDTVETDAAGALT